MREEIVNGRPVGIPVPPSTLDAPVHDGDHQTQSGARPRHGGRHQRPRGLGRQQHHVRPERQHGDEPDDPQDEMRVDRAPGQVAVPLQKLPDARRHREFFLGELVDRHGGPGDHDDLGGDGDQGHNDVQPLDGFAAVAEGGGELSGVLGGRAGQLREARREAQGNHAGGHDRGREFHVVEQRGGGGGVIGERNGHGEVRDEHGHRQGGRDHIGRAFGNQPNCGRRTGRTMESGRRRKASL
mmetsp:Transcript_6091/g.13102  ORF Transcript_6091/g.13102 Transcript_6091/m.13102 type:complete len:240 (-) Transcript_6091:325-1044(-)